MAMTIQHKSNGSATTYARRYSLLMAFGLATEDDDANSLAKKPESKVNEITTLEQAKNLKLTFGKYAGKTLGELTVKDAQYCNWLFDSDKTDITIKKALKMISNANKQKTENEIKEEQEYVDPFTGEVVDE